MRCRLTSIFAECGPRSRPRCGGATPAGGTAGRAAAPLTGAGPGAGHHAVAAAGLGHRDRGRPRRGGGGHAGDRDSVRGAAGPGAGGGGHRVRLRARYRPGLGAGQEHGRERPDGAAGPGAGRARAERGCSAWWPRPSRCWPDPGRRVGDRGRAHLRLADPDDRDVRARARRGHALRGRPTWAWSRAWAAGPSRSWPPDRPGVSPPCSPTPRSSFLTSRSQRAAPRWSCMRPGSREERHERRDRRPDQAVRRTRPVAGVDLEAGPGCSGCSVRTGPARRRCCA